jgi:predicted Fe-Mo cluster-binding NifX family protein
MEKRFIFVRDVEKWLAEGKDTKELPEGTRITAAAADLIKERGLGIQWRRGPSGEEAPPAVEEGPPAPTGQQGIIAVAATGKAPSNPVAGVAARSPYFLLFDAGKAFLEAVENPHADSGGGAGNRVAEWMAERGVQVMVAGNFGRNLAADLEKRGIGRVEASGSSEAAVRAL